MTVFHIHPADADREITGGGVGVAAAGPGGGDCDFLGGECRVWLESDRYFVYDQFGNMVAEFDDNGNLTRTYVYANGQRFAMHHCYIFAQVQKNELYYYLTDQLGSTSILLVAGGGSDATAYDKIRADCNYYAYGEMYQSTEAQNPDYKFTGQRLMDDNDMDCYYFGSRFYDPKYMRFISVDPAGQYASPYIYGGGNPVIGTDPDGEWFIFDDFVIGFITKLATSRSLKEAWQEGKKRAQNSYDIWRGLFKSDPNQGFWGRVWQVSSRFT